MAIHNKIRELRQQKNWTQEQAAEKMEMSKNGYANLERGQSAINLNRLEKIAEVFQIDMWELLQSDKNGLVLQINEGDSGGDISLYASSNPNVEMELLKQELKYAKALLSEKDKQIALLENLLEALQKK